MSSNQIKALIGGIQKFSVEDGPGIRTTVFVKGCPLSCKWCHNPELIGFEQQIIQLPNSCIQCGDCMQLCPNQAISPNKKGMKIDWDKCDNCMQCVDVCCANGVKAVAKEMSVEEILYEVVKDKGFYDNTGGGITLSGGEILSHYEFAKEVIEESEKLGIKVCLDTSGYGKYEEFYDLASHNNVINILYDMKVIDNLKHKVYTGVDNEIILKNLKKLAKQDDIRRKIIMRMPLIKDFNDTDEIIIKTVEFYVENRLQNVTLLPYHTLGLSKMEHIGGKVNEFEKPTANRINKIKTLFTDAGLSVEVMGEV